VWCVVFVFVVFLLFICVGVVVLGVGGGFLVLGGGGGSR